jgi:hypothetical protein
MNTDQCVSLEQYTYVCSWQEYNALPWKSNTVFSLVLFSGGEWQWNVCFDFLQNFRLKHFSFLEELGERLS